MKALVTGGGGYLGFAIVRALLERGDEVSSLQRGSYPELERLDVHIHTGDITNPLSVTKASKNCDVIFHVAAKAGVWGNYENYYQTNVAGTENVLKACKENNIGRLVYTSSPSVIFNGGDEENVDESIDYPKCFFNHYQETKATAEKKVLAANKPQLATIALRPHLIWGPGDPHLIGRIMERASSGKLRLIQSGKLADTTYIDNAVSAHLLAADALQDKTTVSGKTYFITNGEPMVLTELINKILSALAMPPVTKTLSPKTAYTIGAISELVYKLFSIEKEPLMTRFVARQLSCAHWYDISAAKRDLNYEPRVSIEEGLQRIKVA